MTNASKMIFNRANNDLNYIIQCIMHPITHEVLAWRIMNNPLHLADPR